MAQEEQTRSFNQHITQAQEQIEALTDNTANLQEDLSRLANETFQHVQLVLTAYQESIQSLAPLGEESSVNRAHRWDCRPVDHGKSTLIAALTGDIPIASRGNRGK